MKDRHEISRGTAEELERHEGRLSLAEIHPKLYKGDRIKQRNEAEQAEKEFKNDAKHFFAEGLLARFSKRSKE